MSELARIAAQGAVIIVGLELFEIGKSVFNNGWGDGIKSHFRLNRGLLVHSVALIFTGAIFGILRVFGWEAFHGAPLALLLIVVAVAVGFALLLRSFLSVGSAHARYPE